MNRLLFVASEAYPLVKTGGLADVAGSLPEVLRQQGLDVRLLIPAYCDMLASIQHTTVLASVELAGTSVEILETVLPGTGVTTWLLSHPLFSERPGNPYYDDQGETWPDSADRFILLCRLAELLCSQASPLDWRPDILHCNDWHTGPAIALAHLHEKRPLTVFSIHNLAHLGLFDYPTFCRLQLPDHFWRDDALEFYDQLCFMKGGLVYADYITTVSPSYAQEICHTPAGMGLEGLLSYRKQCLHGILNGIDDQVWNPADDPFLEFPFDAHCLEQKGRNKSALQRELGLEPRKDCPLIGFIGRLVEQKGIELLLPIIEEITNGPAQLVILGTGDRRYEEQLATLARTRPGLLVVMLSYNEAMAHRIEAAADIFLMPSLFEPCGLNQLYSLRYATLPVVRAVGGLADTVVDTNPQTIAGQTATGFTFQRAEPEELLGTVRRAVSLWHDKRVWTQLQRTAMQQDFSWQHSAGQYLALYQTFPRFKPNREETL